MLRNTLRTPLTAAFFYIAILAGCETDQQGPNNASAACPAPTASIASVQGRSGTSHMRKQVVTVQGIVTLIEDGSGLYMEDPAADEDSRTSNAIFVEYRNVPGNIQAGSVISATGTVWEIGKNRNSLTAITRVDDLVQCDSGQALPLTAVTLPLNKRARESLEGMRIQVEAPLVVTNAYQLGAGKLTLSANGIQFVPTEVVSPGRQAAKLKAKNKAFALPVKLNDAGDSSTLLSSGSPVSQVVGVFAHDGRGLRVSAQSLPADPVTDFSIPAAPTAGSLRIVGMNLHNYFNGDGRGHGFPTPRGAETPAGFRQQRERIAAAIRVLDPHVLGVMELENDGFGPNSAAADFIQLAEDASGASWAVSRPAHDNTGDDVITVGVFYRSDRLQAIGPAQSLSGAEFKRSRQPLAQVFKPLPDGDRVLVVVNHLKSKGSCVDSGIQADQRDGQGCWNPMRTAAAQKMSAWVKGIAASADTSRILILGDMNAYRNEDPIAAIRDAGFTELLDKKQGDVYSFVFFGQHGTLDYAFSSSDLLADVEQAFIWNVNAALPVNVELPQPWLRFSDHDPVVVDVRSRH